MESNKKACSIIAFVTVMVTLSSAIIIDVTIFSKVIMTFLAGIFLSAVAFCVLFILMIMSFMLAFGFYLIGEYGFWPLTWSFELFKMVLNDIEITPEQISLFRGFRIGFLILCIFSLIMASIALKKDEMISKKVPLKGMSIVALIFSIMGIVVGVGVLTITSLIG